MIKDKIFPLALLIHPACLFQDAQMFGHGGLGYAQSGLQFADAARPVHQQPQDAETVAIRQGL